MKATLSIKKRRQEGDLRNQYNALYNIIDDEGNIKEFNTSEFNNDVLSIDITKPLDLQCQKSYDDTVNLIINDDKNPPRIINTRFSVIEDNKYRIITRNQKEQTNLYNEGKIDQQTRLFRTINRIPKIELSRLLRSGKLPGGNYTLYIKYADNDYNQTDIVAESGIISIVNGDLYNPASMNGALKNEVTDKAIAFKINNIDNSFYKFYVYYVRQYSTELGVLQTECKMISKPYDLSTQEFVITGFEQTEDKTIEDINIKYNVVDSVKTQAQQQNMLFFGNVSSTIIDNNKLQDLAFKIKVELREATSIGWVDENYKTKRTDDLLQSEYYSYKNIYYKLGYWPDEFYRLGVVFIMNNDELTPVYNLRGIKFEWENGNDYASNNVSDDDKDRNYSLDKDSILNEVTFDNTYGVFKNPSINSEKIIIDYHKKEVRPWYYRMDISLITDSLKELGVKGFFFVRQLRLPFIVCQAYSIGIDSVSHTPMLYDDTNKNYFSEGFLDEDLSLSNVFNHHKITSNQSTGSALLCLDAPTNPILQSTINGSKFSLQAINYLSLKQVDRSRRFFAYGDNNRLSTWKNNVACCYIDENVPSKVIDDYVFSTKAGAAEDVKLFSWFSEKNYEKDNNKLVRGVYCPYIAACSSLVPNQIYNIIYSSYSDTYLSEYIKVRGTYKDEFFAISDRYGLDEGVTKIDCFRGDCYSTTNTIRINRNFTDSELPILDQMIDSNTWKNNYKGYLKMTEGSVDDKKYGSWGNINRCDLNAVHLGMWVTFKSLSNYNLGFRSLDRNNVDEQALMGNERSFFPLRSISTMSSNKISESFLLNAGLNKTTGSKRNFKFEDVPYTRDIFDTRIMFSNTQQDDQFKNGYRIFQGLSYADIDRQYGSIVKMFPYKSDLLCVFEHGIGLVPINQKALLSTQQGQSIHLYGSGVLQSQITVISEDFGSTWAESIIKTPIGIYGVDTYAKKIWKFNNNSGFEILSDMKIQSFLNDEIVLAEDDKYPIIGLLNVKSHYNNYKGDVMFTFYNYEKNKEWNLCYNERAGKWVTRYSWTPLYSENINNQFITTDKKRAEILSIIFNNINSKSGIKTEVNQWNRVNNRFEDLVIPFTINGYDLVDDWICDITSIQTSFIDENNNEQFLEINTNEIASCLSNEGFLLKNNNDYYELRINVNNLKSAFNGQLWSNADMPVYLKINVQIKGNVRLIEDDKTYDKLIKTEIGVVIPSADIDQYNKIVRNWLYLHGKAGIFDEIDYLDKDPDNQTKPTYWFNKQEPFEFEFVVNTPTGLHKIFNNLVIISNNVQPKEIEYEIAGDVYTFKKWGILKQTEFLNTSIEYDYRLNQYLLLVGQECKNMENPKYGRRLGNIHYKEDSWYLTIDPIIYKKPTLTETGVSTLANTWDMTRIRDKWIKIRVKYTGDNLVIISNIKTLMTISYS